MIRVLAVSAFFALAACSDYEIVGGNDNVEPGDGRTGGLRGRVCGPDGEHWVVGAEVTLDAAGHVTTGLTDDEGWFELAGVPIGDWTVVVQRGSFETSFPVSIVEGEVTELPEATCIEQGEVEIAVIEGSWDAVEHILDAMDLEYTMISYYSSNSFLLDPAQMQQYDLIFFNCGMDDSWEWDNKAEVSANLRDFVDGGGSIYASDWAYYIVEAGWPDMNTFQGDDTYLGAARMGETGYITADILDPVMSQSLGSATASLNYDLPAWVVMKQTHQGDVLIEGTATYYDYGYHTATVPMVSRLDGANGGAVVYTSFHNEIQTTIDMHLLLQEIILSL